MNLVLVERLGAIIGGVVVGAVSFYSLYKDWPSTGIENNVFKLMLFLLGVGAIRALGWAQRDWLHAVGERSVTR